MQNLQGFMLPKFNRQILPNKQALNSEILKFSLPQQNKFARVAPAYWAIVVHRLHANPPRLSPLPLSFRILRFCSRVRAHMPRLFTASTEAFTVPPFQLSILGWITREERSRLLPDFTRNDLRAYEIQNFPQTPLDGALCAREHPHS